jgi:hypothetical protein
LLTIDKTNLFQKRKKIILHQAKTLPKLSKLNIWQFPNNTQAMLKLGPQEIRKSTGIHSANPIFPNKNILEIQADGQFYQASSKSL